MAKKSVIDVTVDTHLSVDENEYDSVNVVIRYKIKSPISNINASSGMTMQIFLPDGSVLEDPAAARRVAHVEAAMILRKMLGALK